MAEDRSKQSLVIYKGADKVVTGEVGTKSAAITGLVAGSVVVAGDYQCCFTDGTTESPKTDVPGFTVATPAPVEATDVTATPTDDGATVTAG
ncbi:hypothetical protein BSQ39_08220 [Loigolactobacillus backii]|uniref:hypothetical protein n=1 Tax=Loigolactobacillus backii TaxID=375175 RepID=UPI000C1C9BEB|nr:hypothetical protein [Loigolactobacillus backii]PIO83549.1 hypothetical protein BSQ39_08220 [Loigolactobacillus backii]